MSFLLFLLGVLAIYMAYRYINAHENLVRQVQALTVTNSATPVPEPFDLKDKFITGLESLRTLIPKYT